MLAAYYKSPEREALVDRLRRQPGFVGAGIVLQNPFAPRSAWFDAYEVRWLRGQPVPALPSTVGGYTVKLVIVDSYPVPLRR